MADVVDNPSQHRFEMAIGDALAVAHYETEGGRVVLLHTEVPPELAGQGIGSKLARGVFETLRGRGARVVDEMRVHGRLRDPPSGIRGDARRLSASPAERVNDGDKSAIRRRCGFARLAAGPAPS